MKAKTMQTLAKLRNAFMPVQTNKPLSLPWAVVDTTAPLMVKLPLSTEPVPVTSSAIPAGLLKKGDRVQCIWLGDDLSVLGCPALEDRGVRYASGRRKIDAGPEGDLEPGFTIRRQRPTYDGAALMYLADNGTMPEYAVALQADGTTQATLRVTKDGIRLQQDVSGSTQRVAMAEDTGWQDIPLAAGYSGPFSGRVLNGVVYFSGQISGSFSPTLSAVGTVPDIMRPPSFTATYKPLISSWATYGGGARGYIDGNTIRLAASSAQTGIIYAVALGPYPKY